MILYAGLGFFIGLILNMFVSELMGEEFRFAMAASVAVCTSLLAIRASSPGRWELPTTGEKGDRYTIESGHRVPLAGDAVVLFEVAAPDTTRNPLTVSRVHLDDSYVALLLSNGGQYLVRISDIRH